MRGVKSLLVLVVVLAGLGAYIYFVESKKPQGQEPTLGPKVFTVKADAIDEITVKSAGGDRTTLKKAGGAWQITDPVSAPADEAEVSGIVTGLATADIVRTIDENPGDLAAVRPGRTARGHHLQGGREHAPPAVAHRRQDGDFRRSVRQAPRPEEGVPHRRVVRRLVQPRHLRPAAEGRADVRARQGRPSRRAVPRGVGRAEPRQRRVEDRQAIPGSRRLRHGGGPDRARADPPR